MPNSSLALLRANALNVYVVFTPSRMFSVKFDAVKEHMRVSDAISAGRYYALFADQSIVQSTFAEIAVDEKLAFLFMRDQKLLRDKYFGSVWFYGDTTSEYTREAAYLAVRSNMRVVNLSEAGSTLDRFLRLWIGRYGVLA